MAGAADAPESSGARKFSFRPLRLRNNSQSTMNAILPLFVRWDVNPTMISIGSFEIRYYGLMWALALGISAYIFSRIIKREGYPDKLFDSIFWYGVLSTIIGARLGHCLFYDPGYYLTHPVEILYIHQGGLASHGAAVGLLVGLWLFSRKNKLPYIWSLDRIMVPVAIGGAIVRLGNLFNSEIVGAVTDVSWGFKFVRLYPNVPIDSIPVQHPTQLYEAFCYLVIFGILCWLYYGRDLGRRRPGVMFGVGLIGIFLTRFFIEFIKLDQEAFEQGMLLNMGQLLSIPFILLGIYMIYRGMHRSPVDPDTVRVVRQQTVRQQGGSSKPRKHRRMK